MNSLIFIPKGFLTDKTGFIEGFYQAHPNLDVYYITKTEVFSSCRNHIGYVGNLLNVDFLGKKTLFIERGTRNIQINKGQDRTSDVTEIYYDLQAFRNINLSSPNNGHYGILFEELSERLANKLQKSNGNKPWIFYWWIVLISILTKISTKLRTIIKNCNLLTHIESNIKTASWFLKSLEKEGLLTPSHLNLCCAKLIDFFLGLILFYVGLNYKCEIMSHFHYIAQDFVTHLRQLLIYLMGSPIGLKLNYAFNHSLGKFFFYHINLWRVFLQAMQPLLETNFKVLLLPALFGLSYQVSVICDIISLATFHIYCIYVYAARLYALQIKGLTSLWRLFIGRKFNPLRNRVDSCDYSSTQLFIGTLGFTILLFLLPTTLMYYTVFAALRLATLLAYSTFNRLKNLISNVPLYVFLLWLLQSPSISGTPHLNWKGNGNQIDISLAPFSFNETKKRFTYTPKKNGQIFGIGVLVSRLCTGELV